MKGYTSKIDFYRGQYRDYRLKALCASQGSSKEFTDFIMMMASAKSRYVCSMGVILLLPMQEIFPYLALVQYVIGEDLDEERRICCSAAGFCLSTVQLRLIQDIPSSLKQIESITGKTYFSSVSPSESVYRFLDLPEEDRSLLSSIAFYDDRKFLCRIICKRRGWPTAALNRLEVLLNG